jgi:hypothetical protein
MMWANHRFEQYNARQKAEEDEEKRRQRDRAIAIERKAARNNNNNNNNQPQQTNKASETRNQTGEKNRPVMINCLRGS